jgi:hypothetical protein
VAVGSVTITSEIEAGYAGAKGAVAIEAAGIVCDIDGGTLSTSAG